MHFNIIFQNTYRLWQNMGVAPVGICWPCKVQKFINKIKIIHWQIVLSKTLLWSSTRLVSGAWLIWRRENITTVGATSCVHNVFAAEKEKKKERQLWHQKQVWHLLLCFSIKSLPGTQSLAIFFPVGHKQSHRTPMSEKVTLRPQ